MPDTAIPSVVAGSRPGAESAGLSAFRPRVADLGAQGEPYLWMLGGALAFGILMVVGFLVLVAWNGLFTFVPRKIAVVTLVDGKQVAGEAVRDEKFRVPAERLAALAPEAKARIAAEHGFARRALYRTGNYDVYNDDFRWIADFEVAGVAFPEAMVFTERLEWGPFIGRVKSVTVNGEVLPTADVRDPRVRDAHDAARARWQRIRTIERSEIGAINHILERERLALRKVALTSGEDSAAFREAANLFESRRTEAEARYKTLSGEAARLKDRDAKDRIVLAEIGGAEKAMPLSNIVRIYRANELTWTDKAAIYLSRWWEFLSDEPREANTEGGVLPAIFGTFAMTILMVIVVAPFGIVTALYLREYARQGRLVALVRISVNNLAGVPSIVYGVFGLGFFAYLVGGGIDQLFYPERLPNPTFGTGGLLWASLTLALLTVPVVIVATEEAIAAVPRSMREGSLACGASKWQTIRRIVLPRAMPGILTGVILAMARGAGEVAPLMLVGVVKLAPELPIDGFFPFVHLERSFMHLGFHIFDVGFQSRNSEAGKPMVFVTTLLLIGLVAAMNVAAITLRNRLKRRFAVGHF
jgi:phosphate transport system permease protein